MPGDVSRSNPGPGDESPYVPSWCYEEGARVCLCGHHEGYHSDAGVCLQRRKCRCAGFVASGRVDESHLPFHRKTK